MCGGVHMTLLQNILKYNESFVANKDFEQYKTSKNPDKKAVLFTCMDTRLQELGTKALGFNNGDIKVVKNAGAVITHPTVQLCAVYSSQFTL